MTTSKDRAYRDVHDPDWKHGPDDNPPECQHYARRVEANEVTCWDCDLTETPVEYAARSLRKYDGHNYRPKVDQLNLVLDELQRLSPERIV